jgi:hypothetical protein
VSDADHFLCPNGHRVDRVRAISCPEPGCHATVVYEPAARGMELLAALYRAHAALDRAHDHTAETWADRQRWPGPK